MNPWKIVAAFAVLVLGLVSDPSLAPKKHTVLSPADVKNLLAAYGADAASIDRTMRDFKLPEQFDWRTRPNNTGQTAAVFGDPTKPGLYVQLLKRPADDWSQPHSHNNERIVTVLQGTFKIGTGSKFDKDATVGLGPGTVIRDIANQMHYDGTGPEGATIQIVGMGPTSRN